MLEFSLVPHPQTPPARVSGVAARVSVSGAEVLLTFVVQGVEHVVLPARAAAARADGLWKTTCCEMFLAAVGAESYFEFNYSPSTCWAAYRFDAYRAGGHDLAMTVDPMVDRGEGSGYLVQVGQNLLDLPGGALQMGLSAVIEESDGTKSYWALRHAAGPPDFHNRDCFIATLPAPTGA